MARSGNPYGAPRDSNHVPAMMGVSDADGVTMLPLEIDHTNGRLLVSATGGGGSGGTQYAEGATTAPATGTLAMGRYQAVAPSLTDGELYGLQFDSSGNLKVTGSISVGGTTDGATFTAGTSSFNPAGGVYDDTVAALTTGKQGTLRLTANRGMHVNLRNASGTEIGTSGTPVRVDPTGTTTQPISAASLPLPTGAATSAKQPALGTAGSASTDVITIQGISSMIAVKVDGSAVTQPISAASLPLPSGAATSAKQPALGTAGTASSDVITVQGIASMTALKVDGSAVTQPVSGTVAATQSGNWTSRIVGNAGSTLDAAVGAGTAPTNMVAVGGIYNSTEISPTTGQSAALQLDSKGRLRQVIMDAAGNTRGANVTAGNALQADITSIAGTAAAANNGTASAGVIRVTVASDSTGNIATIGTSVTPGTAAANLGKAEDAAHTTGDTGVMALGVRETTVTDLSANNADGDYEPFQVNKSGAMWVTGTPSGTSGWSVATGSIGATKTDIGTANTAGNVGGWYIYNPNSSVAYVQFFNAQASAVTLGTTAPIYSLGIPATSAANIAPGMVGLSHSTAISIAITTTRAGSTGPSSTVDYNIWYKQ